MATLRPFYDRGVISSVDVHVVDQLGRLAGEDRPDVLLALALAVRAPRHGHISVDLADRESLALPTEDDHEQEPLAWPEDCAAWVAAVASSPLCRARHETQRVTPFVLAGTMLTMDRYWRYQGALADALRRRAEQTLAPEDPSLLRRGLRCLFGDDAPLCRQQLAAAMAMLRGLTVVSGGPGTGKTYTIRSILTLLFAQWAATRKHQSDAAEPPRIALCAPTGKAAARMKASLLAGLPHFLERAEGALFGRATADELLRFLVELKPSTIHRLLRWRPDRPTRFRHDAALPLPYDVIVVDETSMVDLALMAKLVDAVPPSARLVLLGDQHQLCSVEAGTVLADVCMGVGLLRPILSRGFVDELHRTVEMDLAPHVDVSEAATLGDCIVQLDRNHRFSDQSGIGTFARRCLAADFSAQDAVDVLLPSAGFHDLSLWPHGDGGALVEPVGEAIVLGYRPYLERLLAGPTGGETLEGFHLDVLARFERFRVLCAHRHGPLGVAGLNRAVVELLAEHVDDFVQSGDSYLGRPILVTENDYVVKRWNGDVGIVVRDASGHPSVAFPAEGGGIDYLAPARLPAHQTVFAMTIHKSQGSEFSHAMVVLPDRPSRILTRELVYTGVTRAADRMTVVGDVGLLAAALERRIRRASCLGDELWVREAGSLR